HGDGRQRILVGVVAELAFLLVLLLQEVLQTARDSPVVAGSRRDLTGAEEGQQAERRAGDLMRFPDVTAFTFAVLGEVIGVPPAVGGLVKRQPFQAARYRLLRLHAATAFAQQEHAVFDIAAVEAAGQKAR